MTSTAEIMAAIENTSSFERIITKERITTLLSRIKEARGSVSIHFARNTKQFNSAILEINPENDTLIFDECVPVEGHDTLVMLKHFNVTARIEGISIHFKSVLKAVNTKNNIASYVTQYPARILYEQRRKTFRVPVDEKTEIPVSISTETEHVYAAYLVDLSSQGIGAYIESNDEFTEHDKKYFCKIHLPNGNFVSSELELRHIQSDDKNKKLQIGYRFINLNPAQRALLERFIMTLQREAIKRNQDDE